MLRGSQWAHLTDQPNKLKICSVSPRACCFATTQWPPWVQAALHITCSCMWGGWGLPRAWTRGQGQVWQGCHGAGVGWGCPTPASVFLLRASAAFSSPVLICLTQGHLIRWFILRKSNFFKSHCWKQCLMSKFRAQLGMCLNYPILIKGRRKSAHSIVLHWKHTQWNFYPSLSNSKRFKSKRLLPYNFDFSQPHLKLLAASALPWEGKRGLKCSSFQVFCPSFIISFLSETCIFTSFLLTENQMILSHLMILTQGSAQMSCNVHSNSAV